MAKGAQKQLEAERSAIKRVTAEIEKLKVRKSAGTTAVRSWRFKYRAWKSRVEIVGKNEILSEDQVKEIRERVRQHNAHLQALNAYSTIDESTKTARLKSLLARERRTLEKLKSFDISDFEGAITGTENAIAGAEAVIESYAVRLKDYQSKREDNLAIQQENARKRNEYEEEQAIAEREYEDAMARYEDDLEYYNGQEEREEKYKTEVEEFNQQFHDGEKIFSLGADGKVVVNQDLVTDLAYGFVAQYQQNYAGQNSFEAVYGDDKNLQGADFDGIQAQFDDKDYDGAQQTITEAIMRNVDGELDGLKLDEPYKVEKPKKPVKREVKKPTYLQVEEPKKVEPVALPAFSLEITYEPKAHENVVDRALILEMDSYASGPYKVTEDHSEDINGLVEKLGHGCPTIEIEDNKFDKTDLLSAISELESAWSGFGSQRNSGHGAAIIAKYRSAVAQLQDVQNYRDLGPASRKFSEASNLIMMWTSSNWWELGGTPTGNAHPWKGMHGKKLGGNMLGLFK